MNVKATYHKGKIAFTAPVSLPDREIELSVSIPDAVFRESPSSSSPADIRFIDLKTQQQRILPRLLERWQDVLEHGQYILGHENSQLESKLAEYAGVRHAIACSSGTDALLMPLMAYGVGPGDAVFTTPFTFVATAEVIALLGATPVFVDIDPRTFNLDPAQLELAIEAVVKRDPSVYPLPRQAVDGQLTPKGIIPVDLFGLPADYNPICTVAQKHGLFVLEDAAQSFGAEYKGRKTCSLGDVAATSFFPAKPLGCYGDGGAIFTNDEALMEKLLSIRVHGQGRDRYENIRLGLNGRLDTLQAAVLLCKLEIFDDEIQRRRSIAKRYSSLLAQKGVPVQLPLVPDSAKSVWAQYSLLSTDRQHLLDKLQKKGIPHAIYYPIPLHRQGMFHHLQYTPSCFAESERISREIFSLPFHPYLSESAVERITSCLA